MCNSDYLALRFLRGWNWAVKERPQPVHQFVDSRALAWVGNMTSNNPRFHGKLTGLVA